MSNDERLRGQDNWISEETVKTMNDADLKFEQGWWWKWVNDIKSEISSSKNWIKNASLSMSGREEYINHLKQKLVWEQKDLERYERGLKIIHTTGFNR